MEKFEDLVNRYNNYYKEAITSNKDKLIEAFVIYYGEEYRQIIIDRYNKIVFKWVVASDFGQYNKELFLYNRIDGVNKVLCSLGFNVDNINFNNRKNYRLIKPPIYYLKNIKNAHGEFFDKKLKLLFGRTRIIDDSFSTTIFFNFSLLDFKDKVNFAKKLYDKKEINYSDISRIEKSSLIAKDLYLDYKNRKHKDYMTLMWYSLLHKRKLNRVVGTTNENDSEQNCLVFNKKDNSTAYTSFVFQEQTLSNNVYLKIGLVNDEILIHEINHNIVRNILGIIDEAILFENGIQRAMYEGNSAVIKDQLLEEILTDKIAIEITDIFHKLGGYIFKEQFSFKSYYSKLFPLVDQFYNALKEPLKEIRITANNNLLYRYIDKETYEKYCDYIQSISLKENNEYVTQEQIYMANLFLNNHLFKNEFLDNIKSEMSREQMIAYYKNLGYKLMTISEKDKTKTVKF